MLKKIISILLCAAILPIGGALAEESTEASAGFLTRVEKLEALGITFDGEISEKDEVTRAKFTKTLLGFTGTDAVGADCGFYDVDSDHPYSDEINTGAMLGYMIGYSDGYFYPDRSISLNEAIKAFVNTLGYEVKANQYGAYPGGYISVGDDIGLLSKVGSGETALTYAEFAIMLENALECDVYKLSFSGGTASYDTAEDNDALWNFHRIIKKKAVVTANKLTGLYNPAKKTANDSYVILDNETVLAGDSKVSSYLAYSVEAYIYYDEDEDLGEVKYAVPSSKNSVLELSEDDILGDSADFTAYNFVYEDASGRTKQLKINEEVSVIYNGVAKPDYVKADLIPTIGHVELIDNDADGDYECISIFKAEKVIIVGTVAPVSEGIKIYDEKDSGNCYLYDDEYEYYEVYVNGEVSSAGSITEKMVVLIGENGEHSRTYAYSTTVTGTIGAIGKDDDGVTDIVEIDGVEYKMTNTCANYPFALGSAGTFRVDDKNHVFAFVKETVEGMSYGYLIKGAYDEAESETDAQLYVLTTNDEIVRFKLSEKLKFNGKTTKVKNLIPQLKDGLNWIDQLIMYEADEDDNMTALSTAQSKDDESADLRLEVLWLQYNPNSWGQVPAEYKTKYGLPTGSTLTADQQSKMRNNFLDEDETVYYSAGDATPYGYYNSSWGNLWWNGGSYVGFTIDKNNLESSFVGASWPSDNYTLRLYNENKDTGYIGAVVYELYDGAASVEKVSSNAITPAIVKKKITTLDEDDNSVEAILAVHQGKEVTITCSDSAIADLKANFAALDVGDIFFYETSVTGKLKTIYRVLDYSKLSDPDYSAPEKRYGNSQANSATNEIHGKTTSDGGQWFESRIAFHKIDKKVSGMFYEYRDWPLRSGVATPVRRKQRITGTAGIYRVEMKGGKLSVTSISWDDVLVNDEAFIYAKNGVVQTMYVF